MRVDPTKDENTRMRVDPTKDTLLSLSGSRGCLAIGRWKAVLAAAGKEVEQNQREAQLEPET